MANYSDLPFSSHMHSVQNVRNETTDFDGIRQLVCFISGTRERCVKCATGKILVLHQTQHINKPYVTVLSQIFFE
jgi:hypothetical protein